MVDDKVWILLVGVLGAFTTLYAALSNNSRLKKSDGVTKEIDLSKLTLDWAKTLISRVDFLEEKVKQLEKDSIIDKEKIRHLERELEKK